MVWSDLLRLPHGAKQYKSPSQMINGAFVSVSEDWTMQLKPRDDPFRIPKKTLNRIGRAKENFFAIIDLTKGFYQAPLSEASKKSPHVHALWDLTNGAEYLWDWREHPHFTTSHVCLCRPNFHNHGTLHRHWSCMRWQTKNSSHVYEQCSARLENSNWP